MSFVVLCYSLFSFFFSFFFFFFNDTATTEIYTLSLHDALPISGTPRSPVARSARCGRRPCPRRRARRPGHGRGPRSEEHTSELQSRPHLVCRLLLEKKKKKKQLYKSNLIQKSCKT